MNVKRWALGLAIIFIALPGSAQEPTPLIIGGVDDADKISSCALAVDAPKLYATPIVTLMAPNTEYVGVTFRFFDAAGHDLGTEGVTVPPPLPTGLPMQLTQIVIPEGLASTRCSLTGRAATAASNHQGNALLIGVLVFGAAGAITDIASNSKKSTTSNATPVPTSTPTASPSPTPSPTPAPTASPSPTPKPSQSPSPTASPRRR